MGQGTNGSKDQSQDDLTINSAKQPCYVALNCSRLYTVRLYVTACLVEVCDLSAFCLVSLHFDSLDHFYVLMV